jgi:hypothetical protein
LCACVPAERCSAGAERCSAVRRRVCRLS